MQKELSVKQHGIEGFSLYLDLVQGGGVGQEHTQESF